MEPVVTFFPRGHEPEFYQIHKRLDRLSDEDLYEAGVFYFGKTKYETLTKRLRDTRDQYISIDVYTKAFRWYAGSTGTQVIKVDHCGTTTGIHGFLDIEDFNVDRAIAKGLVVAGALMRLAQEHVFYQRW